MKFDETISGIISIQEVEEIIKKSLESLGYIDVQINFVLGSKNIEGDWLSEFPAEKYVEEVRFTARNNTRKIKMEEYK